MNLEELEQLFHVNPDELMKMMADTLGPDATQEDVEAAVMEMMANVGKNDFSAIHPAGLFVLFNQRRFN